MEPAMPWGDLYQRYETRSEKGKPVTTVEYVNIEDYVHQLFARLWHEAPAAIAEEKLAWDRVHPWIRFLPGYMVKDEKLVNAAVLVAVRNVEHIAEQTYFAPETVGRHHFPAGAIRPPLFALWIPKEMAAMNDFVLAVYRRTEAAGREFARQMDVPHDWITGIPRPYAPHGSTPQLLCMSGYEPAAFTMYRSGTLVTWDMAVAVASDPRVRDAAAVSVFHPIVTAAVFMLAVAEAHDVCTGRPFRSAKLLPATLPPVVRDACFPAALGWAFLFMWGARSNAAIERALFAYPTMFADDHVNRPEHMCSALSAFITQKESPAYAIKSTPKLRAMMERILANYSAIPHPELRIAFGAWQHYYASTVSPILDGKTPGVPPAAPFSEGTERGADASPAQKTAEKRPDTPPAPKPKPKPAERPLGGAPSAPPAKPPQRAPAAAPPKRAERLATKDAPPADKPMGCKAKEDPADAQTLAYRMHVMKYGYPPPSKS